MTDFVFKDTQGKRYRVAAPDDWTEDQAFAFFNDSLKRGTTKSSAPKPAAYDAQKAARTAQEGQPVWAQGFANLGAGMDTTWEGLKGLFGQGGTDEQIKAKRELDAALAKTLPGGAATQFAGEVLPTLAIPAGGFVKGAQAAGRGGMALGRAAMGAAPKVVAEVAGNALPKTIMEVLSNPVTWSSRMGTLGSAADAALAGASMGAMTPTTSEESRIPGVLLGAAGGAVLPLGVGAAKIGRGYLTKGGARERGIQALIDRLGGDEAAMAATAEVRGYKPSPVVADVPMFTNEILQSPKLASLERELGGGSEGLEQRMTQNSMRDLALREATGGAEALQERTSNRALKTGPLRDTAMERAGEDPFFTGPVVEHVQNVLENSNPGDAASKMAGKVVEALDAGVTPQKLYLLRHDIVKSLNKPVELLDERGAAFKNAQRESMQMIGVIDEALNQASGGKWSQYMGQYQKMSRPVEDAEASQLIRDWFSRDKTPVVPGPGGPVPKLTSSDLGGAMDKYGKNTFGDTLLADTRSKLNALKENIQRSELSTQLRKGVGPEGADVTELLPQLLSSSRISRMGQALSLAIRGEKGIKASVMRDALRDPDLFVSGIEKKLQSRVPLTSGEEMVLELLRAVPGPAAAELASP